MSIQEKKTKILEKFTQKIKGLTDDDASKLYDEHFTGDQVTAPAPPPAAPKCEEELAKAKQRIATLEAQIAATKDENKKLRSTDVRVQAVQRAYPHTNISEKTFDQINLLYDLSKKEGLIKDEDAKKADELKYYKDGFEQFAKREIENLTESLIKVTKDSRDPQHLEGISKMISKWRKDENLDVLKVIDRLYKLVNTALGFKTQEVADELTENLGLPNYRKPKSGQPFNSADIWKRGNTPSKGGK